MHLRPGQKCAKTVNVIHQWRSHGGWASGKAGNGKWKRKMETEMDAENGNGHGIKLAHAHKNSHEVVLLFEHRIRAVVYFKNLK